MAFILPGGPAAGRPRSPNPDVGNNVMTAVFDAAIGERISAASSAVGCTLTVDETSLEGKATCSVPLSSIRVDNDDTKTEHFGQWATHKKMQPNECTLDLEVASMKVAPPVEPMKPVAFTTQGRFTICGRGREDGRPERIEGTIIDLPAGTYGPKRTLRIRARIATFDSRAVRRALHDARVARAHPAVAPCGQREFIDVNIFATRRSTTARHDPKRPNQEGTRE
jgi:hypothetical protein